MKKLICKVLSIVIICTNLVFPVSAAEDVSSQFRFEKYALFNKLDVYRFDLQKEMHMTSDEEYERTMNAILTSHIISHTYDLKNLFAVAALPFNSDTSAEIFEHNAIRPAIDLLLLPSKEEVDSINTWTDKITSMTNVAQNVTGVPGNLAAVSKPLVDQYNGLLSSVAAQYVKIGDIASANMVEADMLKIVPYKQTISGVGKIADKVAVVDVTTKLAGKYLNLFFNQNALTTRQKSFEFLYKKRFPNPSIKTNNVTYEAFKTAAYQGLEYYKKGNLANKLCIGYYDVSEAAYKTGASIAFPSKFWHVALYDLMKGLPVFDDSVSAVDKFYTMVGTMRIQELARIEYHEQMDNIQRLKKTNRPITQEHIDNLYYSGLIYLRSANQCRELFLEAVELGKKENKDAELDVDLVITNKNATYDALMNWEYNYSMILGGVSDLQSQLPQGNTVGNNNNGSWVAEEGDFIYYINTKGDVVKSRHDGSQMKVLLSYKNYSVYSIQVLNNKLYFRGAKEVPEANMYGIYSMNVDGTGVKLIYDDMYSQEFIVVGNTIFHLSYNDGISRMGLDGKNVKAVFEPQRAILNMNYYNGDLYYLYPYGDLYKVSINGGKAVNVLEGHIFQYAFHNNNIMYLQYEVSPTSSKMDTTLRYSTMDGKSQSDVKYAFTSEVEKFNVLDSNISVKLANGTVMSIDMVGGTFVNVAKEKNIDSISMVKDSVHCRQEFPPAIKIAVPITYKNGALVFKQWNY